MKRIALITGVAGGIGRATAGLFAEKGWHVVGIDQNSVGTVEGVSHFITADLSQPEAPEQILSELTEGEKRLDALIHNAALQVCKPLPETTLSEWDRVMAAQRPEHRHRQREFGPCRGHLKEHRRLCCEQRSLDGTHPGHGA
jgi:NAD(P)-dependent dehydrogenase (short-subunit alcohol dehydrogenase family)